MKCLVCNTEFEKTNGRQTYCSSECRYEARLRRQSKSKISIGSKAICDWCGCEYGLRSSSQMVANHAVCGKGCQKDIRANARNIDYTGLSTLELIDIYISQTYACIGCNRVMDFDIMESDHIVPVSGDGSNGRWNIQRLCPSCNNSKSNRPMAEYMALSIPWRIDPAPQWRIIDAHRTTGAILLLDQYMRNCRLYHRARSIHYERLRPSTDGETMVIHRRPEWLTG